MIPISHAAYDIASRFCSSLASRAEAEEMGEKIQSLLSTDTQCPGRTQLELEIQKRECQTLIFMLKDLEWTPGERKTGIYNVKFCTQNTEHFLSIEYDSNCELLTIRVDGRQSTEELSIFNFARNLAGLLGISTNEIYFKLAGIDSKDVRNLFRIDQNQEGLEIFNKSVPRTRFDIKASSEALWKEYQCRFNMVWPSDGIDAISPHGRRIHIASEFKNVAVTYILEKYLTARHNMSVKEPLYEEVLDLRGCFSPSFTNKFGYFDVPLSYFDRVYLSWPWNKTGTCPTVNGICKDFSGVIISAEMMVHDELCPYGLPPVFSDNNGCFLKLLMTSSSSFSHQWLKHKGGGNR